MKAELKVGSLLLCLIAAGCQTVPYQGQARDVKRRTNEGGVIALPLNPRAEDRVAADVKMKSVCGDLQVKITEESEVVVGSRSVQDARETGRDDTRRDEGRLFGMQLVSGEAGGRDTRTSTSVEALKEWQVSYACLSGKKLR